MDTERPVTPVHVQWQPSNTVWHSYDSTALPQTCILQRFSKETNGQRSAVRKSRQHSVLIQQSSEPKWGSHQTTTAQARCGAAAPWPSSWHVSTQTRSASWAGGAETQCYATSIQQRKRSLRGSRSAWSNTETMCLSHLPTGNKTPTLRLWASHWPFMGYNRRPGKVLVRIRQINSPHHTNINKSITGISVDTLILFAGRVALATHTCW